MDYAEMIKEIEKRKQSLNDLKSILAANEREANEMQETSTANISENEYAT